MNAEQQYETVLGSLRAKLVGFNLDKSMFESYHCFEKVLAELGMDESVERMHRHIAAKTMNVLFFFSSSHRKTTAEDEICRISFDI